jgi:integrase
MGSVRKSPRSPSRWEARYRDPSGRQRTKTFDTRASAKAFITRTEGDKQRGSWIDPRVSAVPLAVVAEDWLKSDATKRSGSLARDRSILEQHVLPALGRRPVGSITRADVQRLVNGWTGDYAVSTVGRHYSCFRALLSYAEAAEVILRSPCRGIRIPHAPPREAVIVDGEDVARLAESLGVNGPMVYLAVLGLRWGEVAGLRVGRVDFLRHTVTVATQRTRGTKGGMVEQDPKSRRGNRTLTIPDWLMFMLANHLADRGLIGEDRDALLFVSPDGAALHYSNWRRRVWLPAVEAAGFPGLHFHDLRHTAATALVDEGVDIKTAQTRLGHSEQVMLRIYAQTTERADRNAAAKVGERFKPRSPQRGRARKSATSRPADTT